jgi:hypothetical protein
VLKEKDESRKAEGALQDGKEQKAEAAIGDGTDEYDNEWSWDEVYQSWVHRPFTSKLKSTRKKDLTNKALKNRILAMRRTWNTPKKDEMIRNISIPRTELSTVSV